MSTAKFIEIRENQAEIEKISKNAAKYLANEYNIKISHSEALPTIVYSFLRCAALYLNENKSENSDVELNLMQLIDIGISYRENEDAEKEGNYTPYANPGQEFKLLAKDDDETEE